MHSHKTTSSNHLLAVVIGDLPLVKIYQAYPLYPIFPVAF